MSVIVVASSEPRVGRSLIAAALAYRMGRAGVAVTLARQGGDESAEADAQTFASLEGVVAASAPVAQKDVEALSGTVVLEAPAGPVKATATALKAKVIAVAGVTSGATDATKASLLGTIVTRVPQAELEHVRARAGVLAALPEDRVLAAPSVADIAAAVNAHWLVRGEGRRSIDRVMIGTVASDAASPYFGARDRTCVITRYDKTDIQLAALLTDVEALVLTGGGQPSPYLLDRVRGTHDEVAVLLAEGDSAGVMRAIEGLYGGSRFDGAGKLARAVELLDEAGVAVELP